MTTAYVTAPPEAAAELARTLVEERLAAGVNLVDCDSVYRWDGDVREESEVVLLAKTTAERFPALSERVEELHPYEVPYVERFDEAANADSGRNSLPSRRSASLRTFICDRTARPARDVTSVARRTATPRRRRPAFVRARPASRVSHSEPEFSRYSDDSASSVPSM